MTRHGDDIGAGGPAAAPAVRDASAVFSLPASSRWDYLRRQFTADGYLPLRGLLLSPAGLAELGDEARRLEADAVRRDFRMPCMNDSPRHMTTLGGQQIGQASPVITRLYGDRELMGLLSAVLDEQVVAVHDPVVRHVLNVLHRPEHAPRPQASGLRPQAETAFEEGATLVLYTDLSNVAAKTSTPAFSGSPTVSPATMRPTPTPSPTPCRPNCSHQQAAPTTPSWSSSVYDEDGGEGSRIPRIVVNRTPPVRYAVSCRAASGPPSGVIASRAGRRPFSLGSLNLRRLGGWGVTSRR